MRLSIHQILRIRSRPEIDIHQSQVNCEAFVNAVEAENAWGFQVASSIEIPMLVECSAGNQRSGHTPDFRIIVYGPKERLDDQPFPNEVRRGVTLLWIVLDVLGHHCVYRHCGEKTDALHPLPHSGHQTNRQLVGNLVETERIKCSLACSWRIVAGEKWE